MPKPIETIHERLKRLRLEKGLTQTQVADGIGMGAWQTVQSWENGTSAPRRETQQAVADYFGVSVQYLMTGTDLAEPVDSVRIASLRPVADELRALADRLDAMISQPAKSEQRSVRTQLTGPGVLPKSDTESAHKITRRRR